MSKTTGIVGRMLMLGLVVVLLSSGFGYSGPAAITFQYRGGGARTETAEAWIREFEKQNPHIKVEFAPVPDKVGERTFAAWAAGTGPDVTELWGDDAQNFARAGALLDLRPYVARDMTVEDIKDFFPTAWEASFLKFGTNAGIQFRIPRYIITTVFYYNADQFAQAGLMTPTQLEASKQWTWDTLRQAARRLTVRTNGQVERYGFTTNTPDTRRLVCWVRAAGGEFFDPRNPTRFTGDEPPAVHALTYLQDMIWQDGSTAPNYEKKQFPTGGVAIMEEGNHAVLASYDPSIGDKFAWDIAPRPIGPNGRKSYTGDDGFVIWSNSKNPDAAWAFVKFLTSKQGQEIAARYEGLAPVRRSVMPAYMELGRRFSLDVHLTSMLDAGLPLSSYMVGDVKGVSDTIKAALEASLVRNEKPYEQAIREVKTVIEALLLK